jgi:hypothetical protein
MGLSAPAFFFVPLRETKIAALEQKADHNP